MRKLTSVFGTFANLEPHSTSWRVCNIYPGRAVPGCFTETLGCSRVAGKYVRISVLFTLSFVVLTVSGRVNA